jgi:tRNA threonylcarbamoyladenosine biosynthesis protein TsaE
MELHSASLESLQDTAKQLLDHLNDEVRVLLFEGDLGAGKTTLIKQICNLLGSEENVTSPTFSLINEYQAGELTLYHIDLYRLDKMEDAIHIGIEDYLYSGNWCFIEWPAIIKPMIELPYALVSIHAKDATSRNIRILKCITEPKS